MKLPDARERRGVLIGLGTASIGPEQTAAFSLINPLSRAVLVMRVWLHDALGDYARCALRVGDQSPLVDVSGRMFSDRAPTSLQFLRTPSWRPGAPLTLLVRSHNAGCRLTVAPSVSLLYIPEDCGAEPIWPVEPPVILYGYAPLDAPAEEPATPPPPAASSGGIFG